MTRRGPHITTGLPNPLNLGRANLQEAYLREANLQGANLWNAKLQGANLSNANFKGASKMAKKALVKACFFPKTGIPRKDRFRGPPTGLPDGVVPPTMHCEERVY